MNNDKEVSTMKIWLKKNWKRTAVWLIALDVFVYGVIPALLAVAYWLFGFDIKKIIMIAVG